MKRTLCVCSLISITFTDAPSKSDSTERAKTLFRGFGRFFAGTLFETYLEPLTRGLQA